MDGSSLTSLEHLVGVLSKCEFLDLLLLRALDDLVDVDTLQMDTFRIDVPDFDDMVGLNEGTLRVLGHGLVEVVHGAAELAVTQLVGLVRLDQRVVAVDRFFQDVLLAVEFARFLGFRHLRHGAVLVVADGEFAGLYCSR